MRINILALSGVFDTGLSALLDAFGTVNALAEMTGWRRCPFEPRARSAVSQLIAAEN